MYINAFLEVGLLPKYVWEIIFLEKAMIKFASFNMLSGTLNFVCVWRH
jgi:hypothetical protein